jgi:hypothetical protein
MPIPFDPRLFAGSRTLPTEEEFKSSKMSIDMSTGIQNFGASLAELLNQPLYHTDTITTDEFNAVGGFTYFSASLSKYGNVDLSINDDEPQFSELLKRTRIILYIKDLANKSALSLLTPEDKEALKAKFSDLLDGKLSVTVAMHGPKE